MLQAESKLPLVNANLEKLLPSMGMQQLLPVLIAFQKSYCGTDIFEAPLLHDVVNFLLWQEQDGSASKMSWASSKAQRLVHSRACKTEAQR